MSFLVGYFSFFQANQASYSQNEDSWLLLSQEGFASCAHAIAPQTPFGILMQVVIIFWPAVLSVCGRGSKCVTELQQGSWVSS